MNTWLDTSIPKSYSADLVRAAVSFNEKNVSWRKKNTAKFSIFHAYQLEIGEINVALTNIGNS